MILELAAIVVGTENNVINYELSVDKQNCELQMHNEVHLREREWNKNQVLWNFLFHDGMR